jgi:Zn-dependent alcohol dehydrogenase
MKMKAAVLREFNKPLSVEKVNLDLPKENEVLVKSAFTALCHSDLSMMTGDVPFPMPLVVGHEASGMVEDVGPGVTALKKGDHVVASWNLPCWQCPECKSGKPHICRMTDERNASGGLLDKTSRLTDMAGKRLNHELLVSGFAEYMVLPEDGTIKIREDMPLDQACFLGCCTPTGFGAVYNGAGVKPGESVAIWGMGGVGLNAVNGARLRNADPIIGVDMNKDKEKIAREFGVTHFIDNSKDDPVPIVQDLTDGGADYCFEVVGDPGAINQAYWALGIGSKLITIGLTPIEALTELPLAFHPLHCKVIEGIIYGNTQPKRDIPKFADMAMKGELRLNKLIGKKFVIEEINDAVEAMKNKEIIGRWICEWD